MDLERKLGGRLLAAASMVRQGAVTADIGTDHGYLIAYLAQKGRIPRGYACDINTGPLARARQTIEACGLEGRLQAVLTNGLQGLPEAELDDIIIAGMGGDLIGEIITAPSWTRSPDKHFVLQPMTKADHLRRLLLREGFAIEREAAVEDGRFVYTVLSVWYNGEKKEAGELFAWTGLLLGQKTPAALRYLSGTWELLKKKEAGLRQGGDALEADRLLAAIYEMEQEMTTGQ